MYKNITLAFLLACCANLHTNANPTDSELIISTSQDTSILAALDLYWNEVSRTVQEGDFSGYEALYHKDAVVVFAVREKKSSKSISKALAGWKKGFQTTKEGKAKSSVEFRLSQRINNEDSAHETGIFSYATSSDGKAAAPSYIHFEMLLVKRNGKWLGVMEYQKEKATEAEWDALE